MEKIFCTFYIAHFYTTWKYRAELDYKFNNKYFICVLIKLRFARTIKQTDLFLKVQIHLLDNQIF